MSEGLTYEIAEDGKSILCKECGMRSYNAEDIKEKYCGKCHAFHFIMYFNRVDKEKQK